MAASDDVIDQALSLGDEGRWEEMAELLTNGAAAAAAAIDKLKDVSAPPPALSLQFRELSTAVAKLTADLEAVARSVRVTTDEAALAQHAANEVLSRLTQMTRALTDAVRSADRLGAHRRSGLWPFDPTR